jgi:hypothetical protein
MVMDFQREILEPLRKNASELDRLFNERNSLSWRYSDPDAQAIINRSWRWLNAYQQQVLSMNPNLQRDVNRSSALDQMSQRLQWQRQMIENDYMSLYWQWLANVNKPQQAIASQTQDMLRWSAIAQVRDQGFATGQATKRWDSQAMKWKILSDVNSQWQQQRAQIQSQQTDKMLQADNMKAQTIMGIANQLQQQQQQDLQNSLAAQSRQSSWGARPWPWTYTAPNWKQYPNTSLWLSQAKFDLENSNKINPSKLLDAARSWLRQ